jgi:dienelactone hydrolase
VQQIAVAKEIGVHTCPRSKQLGTWTAWAVVVMAIGAPTTSRSYEQHANVVRAPNRSDNPQMFLDLFRQNKQARVLTTEVRFESAIGSVHGYLARPDVPEPLPAVLLISGEETLNEWMKENSRDLSGIGYVVLAVATNGRPAASRAEARNDAAELERPLTILSATIRWLRHRSDVLPGQVGVLGWSKAAEVALELSASCRLQACVICDGSLKVDRASLGGLRGTPVLIITAARNESARKALLRFEDGLRATHIVHRVRVFDGVGPGFMAAASDTPARKVADKAYFEIYEFLGKYVEDAPQTAVSAAPSNLAPSDEPVATIADIMRAVNDMRGVRGDLIKALEREPSNVQQWRRLRADAAVLAEAGKLLEKRTPPRGLLQHWREQSHSFAATATAAVTAADRRDYAGALRSVQTLNTHCATCHEQHR